MITDVSIMLQALWLGNPKAFNEVIGFQVETFYTSGKDTILWEKPVMLGRTKKINTDKLMKLCFSKVKSIQNTAKVITFESFCRLSGLRFNTKADLKLLFFETARSANVVHEGAIYEYLADRFIKDINLAKNIAEKKMISDVVYLKLITDSLIVAEE